MKALAPGPSDKLGTIRNIRFEYFSNLVNVPFDSHLSHQFCLYSLTPYLLVSNRKE